MTLPPLHHDLPRPAFGAAGSADVAAKIKRLT
jgi:hypothetical protein